MFKKHRGNYNASVLGLPVCSTLKGTLLPSKYMGISPYDEIHLAFLELPKEFALDIIVLACWSIWSIRNDKIFGFAAPRLLSCVHYPKEGLWAAQIKAKPSKVDKIKHWVEQHL